MGSLLLTVLILASSIVEAQLVFGTPAGNYTTATINKAGVLTTPRPPTDFSDEALAVLWQQVGPVQTGPVTAVQTAVPDTTVNAQSPFAQPLANTFGLHPLMPSYLGENYSETRLPANFKWGVSSSAYQIEGAVDADGRGPSIWDALTRVPNFVNDNSTADVAASHYYLYKQDIARLASMGVPSFAFTISWSRIFPFGVRSSPVNALGVAHYDDVIQTAHDAGLEVHVTLFHWDTPLALVNAYGSWSSPEIVEDFFNYAKYVISRYDDVVSGWFTINEPQYCNFQYQNYPHGEYFPAYNNITGGVRAQYACGHHTLLAHAKVAKWYHEEFKGKHQISWKNSGNYGVANSTSEADVQSLQRSYDFTLGWFGGMWTDGDYPQSLKDTLGDILPTLTQEEKDMIKGSCDFYAIDAYSSYTVGAPPNGIAACAANSSDPEWPGCTVQTRLAPNGFRLAPAADPRTNWLIDAPIGVRRFLSTITKELFPTVTEIQITEFGFSEPFEALWQNVDEATWDMRRADYFQGYMDAVLASVVEDGVNVTGAYAWAIFDNFEWLEGNAVRFGLQYVNYTSLERTPKASMYQLLDWFR